MNGTPRLRSAFPQTPQPMQRTREYNVTPSRPKFRESGLRKSPVKAPPPKQDVPLIPTDVVDAPSQRLYVVAFYVALNAWRIYESWTASDDLDSTWLFLKWASIDGIFLFGLQALRIPWLEWAFPTTLAIFLLHVVGNMFLMFRIPIPVGAWATGILKILYDRELSISERSVKPGDIIHNASLILGKQIVHILPEGSAVLNPDQTAFCLNIEKNTANLPIRINQTDPILIELLRLDFNNGENETITISSKQLKQMKRQADKKHSGSGAFLHRDLLYPIRRTGIYRLQRVVDESNLDVRMRSSDALVVSCPRALIKSSHTDKCKGELSNLVLEVEGTPPLKIKYSRQVNQHDRGFSFQNIQPDHLRSPLLGQRTSSILFSSQQPDITWAQSQTIEVPLNESLNVGGEWLYSIEEVHDGCGNVANYSALLDDVDRSSSKSLSQWHLFSVHERPRISLSGCDDQHFIEVARGESVDMPIEFHPAGQGFDKDGPFTLGYSFKANGVDDSDLSDKARQLSLKTLDQKPQIKDSGWYNLNSISSQFCSGEVLEPSSCYLYNPPEPELALKYEKIFDKCANNSVGLLVDLDLTGSPPFRLRYSIEHSKGVETKSLTVDGLRTQLDFTPSEAGFYRYRFLDIADMVYAPRSLKDKVPILEQDVKPPASAHFIGSRELRRACFGEPVSVDVSFLGESPWILQYELVHNGKKSKHVLKSDSDVATILTERLVSGGEYNLVLTSIKDRSNCKRTLKDSIRIDARAKPPHASFGQVERKSTVSALRGAKVDIPLRLSGERPWTVNYRNLDDNSPAVEKTFWQENSLLTVAQEGRYELIGVTDSSCPGTIDQAAKEFRVSWIPRPHIVAVDGSTVVVGTPLEKPDVCQGDDDSVELRLKGNPPYSILCEQQRKTARGTSLIRSKSLKTALHVTSMEMDTSEAGLHTYKFKEVGDNLYDHDSRSSPVIVTQRVNPLPSARFDSPGHIYGFCKEDVSGEESIPVTLEGIAPFYLEVTIKHHSNAKPEVLSVPDINSNRYHLPIPRRHLNLGQHVVSIHKVRDVRGCQRTFDNDSSSVRVAVSDVPTIIPLESKVDYCVGERLSFSLSGHSPFDVFYTFDGVSRKATSRTTNFRRIAERPGVFTITAVSDGASGRCKAHKNITKTIHEMPSVRISRGQTSVVDIHEGGEAELHFEFWGTPPFEFTYIRSSIPRRGAKAEVLDIKHDISYEHKKTIKTSDEGSYEVVAIKDKFCSFSSQAQIEKSEKLVTGS
ncbi:putative nuclear envelope pore membrane protein [Aspergillus clavatus NRRL 1]|uniref:Nuclear envelope pore membrane protein, putative n=1 Tax=Aspergillus clavatus (strain ATCC 1007 / CBS 513.65 / DSM 816 / NCTC 3887 / NRRL 1 / QM 1276 / 107) TaxID=344612 RepID=A1CJ24_ASPCL|nr:nuclear envelope pore membrane protein, putative [Aspergillus clavatus NRRL 1]EAW09148.1 nuclear envelope pore membrane protein, putative [Aspergillus clavatus NRRL 1]